MEQALITRKDPALVQAQEDTDERLHIASFVLSVRFFKNSADTPTRALVGCQGPALNPFHYP